MKNMETQTPTPSYRSRLVEVVTLFLRLGVTAFGGPAAHIAIMHDEVVRRRKWVSEQDFLDLLGTANLIPGPTSTELAIYLGFRRVGWIGLVLAGVCFILPAMLIVLALAWAYVRFGTTPLASGIFYGILPVVIAIVAQALWNLGTKAVKSWLTGVLGLLVVALYFFGVNILILLLAAGLIAMFGENLSRIKSLPTVAFWLPLCRGGPFGRFHTVQPAGSIPELPQSWGDTLRQWLCAAGLSARRFCARPRLAHRSATDRRHRDWTGYARTRIHHRHFYRLPPRRSSGSNRGDRGDLPAFFCLHSRCQAC